MGALFGGVGAILLMHRVRPGGWQADPGMAVTPERLLRLIGLLRRDGYEIIALDEALNRLQGGSSSRSSRRFACLTFDDGYRDNYDILWPLLRREGLPATIYLTTGYIDGGFRPWPMLLEALIAGCPALAIAGEALATGSAPEKDAAYTALHTRLAALAPGEREPLLKAWGAAQGWDMDEAGRRLFLDWDCARAMAADGLVQFGAHTVTHPRLADLGEAEAFSEIDSSRRLIAERTGIAPRHFAFPFGKAADAGHREERLAREAGFSSAAYAFGGPVRRGSEALALPRIAFSNRDDEADIQLRLSGAAAALRPRFRNR